MTSETDVFHYLATFSKYTPRVPRDSHPRADLYTARLVMSYSMYSFYGLAISTVHAATAITFPAAGHWRL